MTQFTKIAEYRSLALIVLTFGMGYFLSYFLRNVNAIISPDIVLEFSLNATEIGLLTSTYFIMGALSVIPGAILLDRFGPQRVLVFQLLIASIGSAIFAIGDSFLSLLIGRTLIGLGITGCLATALKSITVWFPRNFWATGNSLVLGIGSLGVILGTKPLQVLLEHITWRELFWLCIAVALVTLAIALIFIPNRNVTGKTQTPAGDVFRNVLKMPIFWHLMPVASLSLATFFAIQGLWASSWMSDVAGLSQSEIGFRLLIMAVAMSLGMLINGTIADFLLKFGIPTAAVIATGVLGLISVQVFMVFQLEIHSLWIWAVMGFTGNIGALGYPIISRQFDSNVSARVMSLLAMSNYFLAFIVQFSLGWFLDVLGQNSDGTYPASSYSIAFGLFLILQIIALLWFFSLREIWVNPKLQEAADGKD